MLFIQVASVLCAFAWTNPHWLLPNQRSKVSSQQQRQIWSNTSCYVAFVQNSHWIFFILRQLFSPSRHLGIIGADSLILVPKMTHSWLTWRQSFRLYNSCTPFKLGRATQNNTERPWVWQILSASSHNPQWHNHLQGLRLKTTIKVKHTEATWVW